MNKGYKIYSVEQVHNSIPLHEFKLDKSLRYAFVFGNEINGVDDEIIKLSDGVIEIPQLGSKHSLNISVSTGIVLWEMIRQLI
jgi:tRNA G18 (ribose-2'-O)-methylase SpoU